MVLDWVTNGIKLDFVSPSPCSAGQDQHSHYSIKLKMVEQLLSQTVGHQVVHGMLHRCEPTPVPFANRVHVFFTNSLLSKLKSF